MTLIMISTKSFTQETVKKIPMLLFPMGCMNAAAATSKTNYTCQMMMHGGLWKNVNTAAPANPNHKKKKIPYVRTASTTVTAKAPVSARHTAAIPVQPMVLARASALSQTAPSATVQMRLRITAWEDVNSLKHSVWVPRHMSCVKELWITGSVKIAPAVNILTITSRRAAV